MRKTRKSNVSIPRNNKSGAKQPHWTKSTNYVGVTGKGKTGEGRGSHTTRRHEAKRSRGHTSRKYTTVEKLLLKGLTGSRES